MAAQGQLEMASKAEGRRKVHLLPEKGRTREDGRDVGLQRASAQAGRRTGTLP